MSYPFEIEKVPAFLGTKKITKIYQDQYDHIVKPVMEVTEKAFNGEVDSRLSCMLCPPGSGKTTVFNIDLIWRVAAYAVKKNSKNNLIVLTAPDSGIVEDNFLILNELFTDNKILDYLLDEFGIDWRGLHSEPCEVRGRGLEIVVCTIQMAAGYQTSYLKEHSILMMVNDEAHRGLGCPDGDEYPSDIGHSNSEYEARWFTAMNELHSKIWIGMTGSATRSMENNTDLYNIISDKMEKSEWRLPFFCAEMVKFSQYDGHDLVEAYFVALAKRNAINKYLHSKISSKLKALNIKINGNYKIPVKMNDLKTTGMIKCGMESQMYMTPDRVVKYIHTLQDQYRDETFTYGGKELSYHIGAPAILTVAGGVEQKTGGSNGECIALLNSESSKYNSVSMINIGAVGVNIENCGVMGILPVVENIGSVWINLYQLLCRLDRNKYGAWMGEIDYEISQIPDAEIRDLLIKLAVNLATKQAFVSEGGMVQRAYDKVLESHVLEEDAYGFLHGLVSTKRQITNSTEQDEIYKLYKNDNPHCEVCEKNEDAIPMCEVTAQQNHLNMSDDEFNEYWFGCMDVDHEDGDHTNNDTENLFTKCKNEHQFKTMMKKDYLNRYDKSGKLI